MSDEQPKGNPPSHHAFHVKEGKEGKNYFNRIGVAFEHKDGKGFNLQLDSTPVDGRVTLRTPQERLKAQKEGTHSQNLGKDRDQSHQR